MEPVYLGVQSFNAEEWTFITGLSYYRFQIRSIPLSVFSYDISNTNMGVVQRASDHIKPFLTYLREDDTIETLSNRIIEITGENGWETLSLISRQFRAHELPVETSKPTIQVGPQPLPQQQNDIDIDGDNMNLQ